MQFSTQADLASASDLDQMIQSMMESNQRASDLESLAKSQPSDECSCVSAIASNRIDSLANSSSHDVLAVKNPASQKPYRIAFGSPMDRCEPFVVNGYSRGTPPASASTMLALGVGVERACLSQTCRIGQSQPSPQSANPKICEPQIWIWTEHVADPMAQTECEWGADEKEEMPESIRHAVYPVSRLLAMVVRGGPFSHARCADEHAWRSTRASVLELPFEPARCWSVTLRNQSCQRPLRRTPVLSSVRGR